MEWFFYNCYNFDGMIHELQFLGNTLNIKLTNLIKDQECEAYLGYSFHLESLRIKYRKAKITPTKTGQFVTLWKRNVEGKTIAFHEVDPFDFYLIETKKDMQHGLFVFPKKVLVQQQILSSIKEGKRGFRVYPIWDVAENKQAKKTQVWQSNYFINFNQDNEKLKECFQNIFKEK